MADQESYGRDQIVGIINSVLGKINTQSEEIPALLTTELADLRTIIEDLGSQLHTSNIHDINEAHIPDATDELFAVIEATEEATHTIMESCEEILGVLKNENPDLFEKVEKCIVSIFEACTFQDITGQRIKKVTGYLKEIDTKTASILKLLKSGEAQEKSTTSGEGGQVVSLLNGPGLAHNALTQGDIDKLLDEFDGN